MEHCLELLALRLMLGFCMFVKNIYICTYAICMRCPLKNFANFAASDDLAERMLEDAKLRSDTSKAIREIKVGSLCFVLAPAALTVILYEVHTRKHWHMIYVRHALEGRGP